jgi:hypothetical protein
MLMQLRRLLLTLPVVLSTACESIPTQPASRTVDERRTSSVASSASMLICTSQAVPSGHVVVGVSHSSTCPNYDLWGTPNAITVRTPSAGMTICTRWPLSSTSWAIQPIPAGYVAVETTNTTACADFDINVPNAVKISTPVSPMVVCTRWPVSSTSSAVQLLPAGYVVVETTNTTACSYFDINVPNAIKIRVPASPTTICTRWPLSSSSWAIHEIPPGYVVVAAEHKLDCSYYDPSTPNAVTIRTLASPISICARWPISSTSSVTQPIPAGYVVKKSSSSTTCAYFSAFGPANVYTIQQG